MRVPSNHPLIITWALSLALFYLIAPAPLNGKGKTKTGVPEQYLELSQELYSKLESGKFLDLEIVARGDTLLNLPKWDIESAILIVDTSGSMRERRTNYIKTTALHRIAGFLLSMPHLSRLTIISADGDPIYQWKADDGLFAVEHSNEVPIIDAIGHLKYYSKYSDSEWDLGIRYGLRLARVDLAKLKSELFYFGDEYTGNFWEYVPKLNLETPTPPINVIEMHELASSNQYLYSNLSASATKFKQFGRYLATLTNGRYCVFIDPSLYRKWESIALGLLALEHPKELWSIAAEGDTIAELNQQLADEFSTDRKFLQQATPESELTPNGITVTLRKEDGNEYPLRCYIQRTKNDGSEAQEYMLTLQKRKNAWKVIQWETFWEWKD